MQNIYSPQNTCSSELTVPSQAQQGNFQPPSHGKRNGTQIFKYVPSGAGKATLTFTYGQVCTLKLETEVAPHCSPSLYRRADLRGIAFDGVRVGRHTHHPDRISATVLVTMTVQPTQPAPPPPVTLSLPETSSSSAVTVSAPPLPPRRRPALTLPATQALPVQEVQITLASCADCGLAWVQRDAAPAFLIQVVGWVGPVSRPQRRR